jgi:diphosphomevalonate decarboxylase
VSIATACANIALVKYWGKRNSSSPLNLPQTGSLSLTLDALRTSTQIELHDGDEDIFILDGAREDGAAARRVSRHLDLFRGPNDKKATVSSVNQFPTAAGLASSASGFAALTRAAASSYGCDLSLSELSALARRGSGSAARSIFGGYVQMNAGQAEDGVDAHAQALPDIDWDLRAVIAVADSEKKEIGSTEGMDHTKSTSPYHESWVAKVDQDVSAALVALRSRDFDALALVVEGSCLAMHADAMAARPGIIYFSAATLCAIKTVRQLRAEGVEVLFTVDAGPHLVAFTPPANLEKVANRLAQHPEIKKIIRSNIGAGVRDIDALPAGRSF